MEAEPSCKNLPDRQVFPNSKDGNFISREPVWQKVLLSVFVFVWPLIYFWRQVIPVQGRYIRISNDFERWYYVYKIYLLDHLSHLKLPLWSPAEAAGFPFYSSPLTQTFYPLNFFLTIFYRLAGGYTRLDHQIFTILGVSIFSLGLFFWLKQLNLNLRAVLFATLVMSVSFKVADILRFPNAIHTAAWYPWILFAITKILQKQSVKELARYGFLLVFFLICFFTGGYPYYIYYSLFLFLPYLLLFMIPKLRHKVFGNQLDSLISSITTLILSCTLSLLVCGMYLYQVNLLLKDTVGRGGGDFSFSTSLAFNYVNTIGSLIFPPIANPEGWYYFGILGVLLILLYYFSGLFNIYSPSINSNKLEEQKKSSWYQDIWVKIFILVWIILITYITYGQDSYLFIFLWKYMPFFSRLRAWSRMNIILVPIIGLLLAISYSHFEKLISQSKAFKSHRRAIYILIGAYVTIFIIQYVSFTIKLYDNYWISYLLHLYSKDVLFLISGVISFGMIWLLLHLAPKVHFQSPRILGTVVAGFIILSALDMGGVGANMWIFPSPRPIPKRYQLNVDRLNLESFTVPRIEATTLSINSAFRVGNKDTNNFNWYFNRYVQFLENTEDQLSYRKQLLGVVDGKKLYFSKAIAYNTIEPFIKDATQFNNFERVVSYTGDKLVLDVNVPTEGYLSFIDNWDSGWEAAVDGRPTQIELLFGLFKSVRVTEGKHRVVFAYRPIFFKMFTEKIS